MFTKNWIVEKSIPVINSFEEGVLTIRALHYKLVGLGMTNDQKHYKRVVNAMIWARWEGLVSFSAFVDNDRESLGETKYEETSPVSEAESTKQAIGYWLENYSKNVWENQKYYVEVFVEKKALQGVLLPICSGKRVALNPCKGYPSLTFLYDASIRFKMAASENKELIILYFGDYDPSGEDIPRSLKANMLKLGVGLELEVFALTGAQVKEWNLPHAPTKVGDSRTAKWEGVGQVELDALDPEDLQGICRNAINEYFDKEKHRELMKQQEIESIEYKKILKEYVSEL